MVVFFLGKNYQYYNTPPSEDASSLMIINHQTRVLLNFPIIKLRLPMVVFFLGKGVKKQIDF